MKDEFIRIARVRRKWAHVLFLVILSILLYGFYEVITSVHDFMAQESCGVTNLDNNGLDSTNQNLTKSIPPVKEFYYKKPGDSTPTHVVVPAATTAVPTEEKNNQQLYYLGNFFARMALLSFVFFLAQLLIRLYKYNMGLSDHYRTRADALQLAKDLQPDEINHFTILFTALAGAKVEIDTPEKPPISTETPKKPEGIE